MESISCVLRHSGGGSCLPADAPAVQSAELRLLLPQALVLKVCRSCLGSRGEGNGEAVCLQGLCRSHQPDFPNRLWPCKLNVHLVPLPAAACEKNTSSTQTILQVDLENIPVWAVGGILHGCLRSRPPSSSVPSAPRSPVPDGRGSQLAPLQALIFFISKVNLSLGTTPYELQRSCTNTGFPLLGGPQPRRRKGDPARL